jgi:hypothetical protein
MGLDVLGFGHQGSRCLIILPLEFLGDDLVAKLNALVTDVHRRSSNELANLFLRLATERAAKLPSLCVLL